MSRPWFSGTDAYLEVRVSETAFVLCQVIEDMRRNPGDPTRLDQVTRAAERWQRALHALEVFRDDLAREGEWT